MQVAVILSTKGGVGKTTTAANLGGIVADAGRRVILVDIDVQPTLSSFFSLRHRAPCGAYELLSSNLADIERLVSRTSIQNLDLVLSNDSRGDLNSLLLHAPDGRLRLRHLLPIFRPHYDLMIIDTQGARSVLLEMAALACDIAISPVTPEFLAAREFRRGTVQLLQDLAPFRHWGIHLPPLRLLLNRVPPVSTNSRMIEHVLRETWKDESGVTVLGTNVPALEAYPRAAALGTPVHRVERRRPGRRIAPAAAETMKALACELFPSWRADFDRLLGRAGSTVAQGESID